MGDRAVGHLERYADHDDALVDEVLESADLGRMRLQPRLTVRDIMVPRLDIVAVERSVPSDELIATITNAGHSRIPVYHGSVDRILGASQLHASPESAALGE